MTTARFRQSLLALTIAWLGIVAFAAHLLISAEIGRHERTFEDTTRQLSNGLKHKLDTNEAVLAGFVAFLRAVEGNDRLMLQTAGLGIAVMQAEGAAVETVLAADVVVPDIIAGLDLLLHPLRLVATLRV